MKVICLYGALGNQFGRVHQYDVSTPAEAVKALSVTLKGFKQALIDGGSYKILIGGKTDLDISETVNPVSDRETIRIVPVIAGASSGPLKIIAGAALIYFSGGLAAGFGATGSAAGVAGATAGTAGFAGITAGTFSAIGVSLVIGGVSQLLFSPQSGAGDSQERPENKPSFIFNGAVNTTRQGNPVPLCYGRMIVGSQVISAGLKVAQI
jgi:predicted phage tail protein